MCGRYANKLTPDLLARLFRAYSHLPPLPPHYNSAPGQPLPVIRRDPRGARQVDLMRWGLVPSWSQGPDTRFSMINARAETVADKPAYRGPFRQHRCLVPANGFYEWKSGGGTKQPWFFSLASGEPFAFAGLWDHWIGADGSEIDSFTVIVTRANACVAPVHARMPVILKPDDYALWLGEGTDFPLRKELEALLRPYPAAEMAAWPVSRRVNSPANDDESLLDAVEETGQGLLL